MLTEKFLDDNPELWNLEVLRISLYGSNAMVYEEVTKHKQGFKRVKQNVIDFLKYNMRSQVFAKSLQMVLVKGALKRLDMLKFRNVLTDKTKFIMLNQIESIDIDTSIEFEMAEYFFKKLVDRI